MHCTPFPPFLFTLPFPMSRCSSWPGDASNAIYSNTSILSVLSLTPPLSPPLVLSRPAVLSPTLGLIQWRILPLKARSMNVVKCLPADPAGGMFGVHMQNKPAQET